MRLINFSGGNDVGLLRCGTEFFPALIAAIDAARHEIYLETYIFSLDDTGMQVCAALQRAAARGVLVSVITDWVGTGRTQTKQLKTLLVGAGVSHRSFNPWFRRGVARSHRKLCVVDRVVAFVGGLNINDDSFDDTYYLPLPAPCWDFAVQVRGLLVAAIRQEMLAQWIRLGKMKWRARWEQFCMTYRLVDVLEHGPVLAALVVRDNLRHRRTIERAYLYALEHAHDTVLLANPYFAPSRKLRRALEDAARRGVRVTLLLGVGHYSMQDAVAHAFYPKLLKAGVRVVEYRKTQLHAKVAVIDDVWVTVGSSNYDGLSLLINQEANVVINDVAFSRSLRIEMEAAVRDGQSVCLANYADMPWYKKWWFETALFVYRGMIRIIASGRAHKNEKIDS